MNKEKKLDLINDILDLVREAREEIIKERSILGELGQVEYKIKQLANLE